MYVVFVEQTTVTGSVARIPVPTSKSGDSSSSGPYDAAVTEQLQSNKIIYLRMRTGDVDLSHKANKDFGS